MSLCIEVLVHPYRTGNDVLAERYREILLHSDNLVTFEISHEISEMASRVRAKHSVRTPDAIQIAVGVFHEAKVMLTNDSDLKKVNDIEVLVLDDFVD